MTADCTCRGSPISPLPAYDSHVSAVNKLIAHAGDRPLLLLSVSAVHINENILMADKKFFRMSIQLIVVSDWLNSIHLRNVKSSVWGFGQGQGQRQLAEIFLTQRMIYSRAHVKNRRKEKRKPKPKEGKKQTPG